MANSFFNASGNPGTRAAASSSVLRQEFANIMAGFDKMPTLTGNAGRLVRVNASGTALTVSSLLSESATAVAVTGALTATGTLTGGTLSITGASATGALTVTGTASVSGAISGATATLTGAVNASSAVITNGVTAASLAATGAVSGATATFTGAASAASVTVAADATLANQVTRLSQVQTAIASAVAAIPGKNRVINGTFSVNQRAFAGGSLAAGVYGHDRFKGGAAGVTYTVSGETATITAGALQQVIEGLNLPEGGTYVLSWAGTATASVNGGTATASPLVVTGLTAGANATIQFGTGTVTRIQFEAGATRTAFERRLYSVEIALCQRYFEKSYDAQTAPGAVTSAGAESVRRTGAEVSTIFNASFKVAKRAIPTVVWYNPATGSAGQLLNTNGAGSNITVTGTAAVSPTSENKLGAPSHASEGTLQAVIVGHWTASAEL